MRERGAMKKGEIRGRKKRERKEMKLSPRKRGDGKYSVEEGILCSQQILVRITRRGSTVGGVLNDHPRSAHRLM